MNEAKRVFDGANIEICRRERLRTVNNLIVPTA